MVKHLKKWGLLGGWELPNVLFLIRVSLWEMGLHRRYLFSVSKSLSLCKDTRPDTVKYLLYGLTIRIIYLQNVAFVVLGDDHPYGVQMWASK